MSTRGTSSRRCQLPAEDFDQRDAMRNDRVKNRLRGQNAQTNFAMVNTIKWIGEAVGPFEPLPELACREVPSEYHFEGRSLVAQCAECLSFGGLQSPGPLCFFLGQPRWSRLA